MSFGDGSNQRILEAAAAATILLARHGYPQPPLRRYPENGYAPDFVFDTTAVPAAHTGGFIQWVGRTIVFLGKLLCLFVLSAVSYGIFYQNAMPAQHALKELHFDYTGGSAADSEFATREQFSKHHLSLFPRFTQEIDATALVASEPVPTATVDLLANHNEWYAYYEDVLPPPLSRQRLLHAKQHYFIEVALKLPESRANKETGMFGVITELYSSESASTCAKKASSGGYSLLAVSRRSFRFPHQTPWISAVSKVIMLVALLIGAVEETRTVAGPAFRHYVESSERPLVRAYMHSVLFYHLHNWTSSHKCITTAIRNCENHSAE
jgi:Putative adipose-regulatory protein (Seipin)